ncbi:tryptophan--tRNA ligase [Demequina sp. B12]|uniref:tryptophan--tRNA ligase n=1 Tax=Demequina sp. B12 TaxID=2992757 RepID=UPI00237B0077|nr:tryptophan--tRNA ligase [Demequina sp. B12]MDE0572646.1 tryptophan--tRNA ligase [Demequina sp. B12]
MAGMKPRVFSAMQPTADSLQLGNFLGALVEWVKLQDTHDAIYGVVDLHALTVAPDPEVLRRRSRVTAAQFLAAGVDPSRSIVFLQSHVPEHAELAWLLSTFTGMGEAGRMTQFKDKSAKVGESGTNVGLFTYPILMAADILLYDTNVVPVGEDQRQHLELSRDLAMRLNSRLGEDTVTVPEPHIVKETAKIFDLQDPTKKMSKSFSSPKGIIEILQDPKSVAKNIKSAATDSGSVISFDRENKAGVSNLLTIYSALDGRSIDQLVADYEGKMYGHLKVDLAEVVVNYLTPVHDAAMEWIESPDRLDAVLADGAAKASAIASQTLNRLYDRVGLLPPAHRR